MGVPSRLWVGMGAGAGLVGPLVLFDTPVTNDHKSSPPSEVAKFQTFKIASVKDC